MTQPAATVNVPLVGAVQRRWVYIGAGTVGLVVVYAYLARRRRNAAAAAVGIDPATGSVGDLSGSFHNPVPGAVGSSDPVDSQPDTIDTNDAWVRAVIDDLAGLSWDAQFAAAALGKYLAGALLTQDELQVVRTAWAVRGKPPQGAPEPALVPTGGPASTPPPDPTPAPAPAPTPAPAPAPAPPRRYVITVKYTSVNPPWNSTLSGIASRTGRTVSQLASWNGISNPNVIGIGVRIWIDPPGTYVGTRQFP